MTVFENIRCGLLWSRGYRYSFWHLLGGQKALNAEADRLLERLKLGDRRNLPGRAAVLCRAAGARDRHHHRGRRRHHPARRADRRHEPQRDRIAAVELIRGVSEGKTLIMVEHDMSVVFGLADRITVLVYGEVIASDAPAAIRGNAAVQEAYLGTVPA